MIIAATRLRLRRIFTGISGSELRASIIAKESRKVADNAMLTSQR
jgi:hypothetical protein